MKKLIAVLMGLMLLCGAAAGAEEALPYLETQDQNVYFGSTLLTEGSYPQVCISPYSTYALFESDRNEPWYVTFPAPDGAQCSQFTVDSCHFLDLENLRQISYQAMESYSYETFLNKCEDESNIILDGSDKKAAYIKPENGNAYALLGLDEIARGAKLYVSVHLDTIRKIAEDERAGILTDLITKEVDRISGGMSCVKLDRYWTDGAYQGVKLFCGSIPGMTLTQDLPEIDFHLDGESFGGKAFISTVDGQEYTAYVAKDRALTVRIEAEISSNSYVFYNREESEYTMVTLDDGSEWGLYVANEWEGKPYSVHASRVLSSKDKNGDDRPVYFNYHLTTSSGLKLAWADLESFKTDLNILVQNLHFTGLPESAE